MSNLKKTEGQGLISLLHNQGGGLVIPQPFERDIFLFDTHVAGTNHIEGMDELGQYLQEGDRLDFLREPDNVHDQQAIAIRTVSGVKIGYVPRADNLIFARLMDAGKLLFAKIKGKELHGSWLRIDIGIYLHE